MFKLSILGLLALAVPLGVLSRISYSDYDNSFVDPSYILAKGFNKSTAAAQTSIIQWADFLDAQGPWCEYLNRCR